jgi:type II secretory pathway component GspD/PulD (secretin)
MKYGVLGQLVRRSLLVAFSVFASTLGSLAEARSSAAVTVAETGSTMTLTAAGVSVAEMEEAISNELGRTFLFAPKAPVEALTVELLDLPAEELLNAFAKHGAVAIREAGGNVSIRATEIPAEAVAALYRRLLGNAEVNITGKPQELVSLEIYDMPLPLLVAPLRKTAGIVAITSEH